MSDVIKPGQALPVAVLIAAYNRADWVGQAVASALAQTPNPPAEVIVIDDGSTDGTAGAAKAAGAHVISHDHNRGAAAARNTGTAATDQPWIAPLDSDDRWLPDMLSALWPMRAHYSFVAGASVAVDVAGNPIGYGGILSREPIVLSSPAPLVFPENFISASGVIARRDAIQRAGGWRADQGQAEDLDLWIRLMRVAPGLCVPRVVTSYRNHSGQKSQNGASSRAAVMRLIDRYRGDSWWTEELVEQRRAVMAWDDLREAIGEGDRWRVMMRAWWLAQTRTRRRALRDTLIRRRRGRGRFAAWNRQRLT